MNKPLSSAPLRERFLHAAIVAALTVVPALLAATMPAAAVAIG